MIDTLKYALRIEREMHLTHDDAAVAAFIAKDMFDEATRDLATKTDLLLTVGEFRQSMLKHTIAIGGMMAVAVGLMLAGTAYLLSIYQFAH